MRRYTYLLLFGFIVLCIACACAGDTYRVVIEDIPIKERPQKDTTNMVDFIFTVGVQPHNSSEINNTRYLQNGIVNLPVGRYVTLYIYQGDYTPETGDQYRQDKYVVKTAGYLTPLYQGVSLQKGTYNIYAVSEFNNTSDKTPNFDVNQNGLATTLYNELDYLWWSKTGVEVTGETPQTVPILFEHVATKVVITCTGATGYTLTTLTQLTLGEPDTADCNYQLATGHINASTKFQSQPEEATLDGFVASLNFVPFDASNFSQITGQADVILEGYSGGWVSFSLPLPDGKEFSAGYEYLYTLEFAPSSSRSQCLEAVAYLNGVSIIQ